MKLNKLLAVIGLALFASVINSQAQANFQTPIYRAFSSVSTTNGDYAVSIKVSYAVAPARSANSANVTPFINFLAYKPDTSTSAIVCFTATNSYYLGTTNAAFSSGQTNILTGPIPYVGSTNGFVDATGLASNTPVLIRHLATETYELNLMGVGTQTNVILQYPLVATTQNGDLLYALSKNAIIPAGTAFTQTTIGPAGNGIANGNFVGVPYVAWLYYSNINQNPFFTMSGNYQ